MTGPDPLDALLREWKSPEPGAELDEQVVTAYRAAVPSAPLRAPAWRRFWGARISVPAPLLLAAMAALVLFFWYRSTSVPSPPPHAAGVVTRLNATGFEPLPNGEAHIVPVKEIHQ
jgi:hypothetical protein